MLLDRTGSKRIKRAKSKSNRDKGQSPDVNSIRDEIGSIEIVAKARSTYADVKGRNGKVSNGLCVESSSRQLEESLSNRTETRKSKRRDKSGRWSTNIVANGRGDRIKSRISADDGVARNSILIEQLGKIAYPGHKCKLSPTGSHWLIEYGSKYASGIYFRCKYCHKIRWMPAIFEDMEEFSYLLKNSDISYAYNKFVFEHPNVARKLRLLDKSSNLCCDDNKCKEGKVIS